MALKRLGSAAIRGAGLLFLVWGCGNGAGDPMLESMPQPDLSQVSAPLLLEVLQQARETLATAPDSAAAWAHLGHLYFIHGWEEAAIPCYQQAAQIERDEFRWLYFLGRALYEQAPARAAEVLTRALALNPAYPPAHLYCAYAYRNLGHYREARHQFQRALEQDPKNYFAHLGLGQLALSAGQLESAQKILGEALELDSKPSEAHAGLSQAYQALGKEQAALHHAQSARKHTRIRTVPDPLWREAEAAGATSYWFSKRGERYLSQRNFEAALAEFSRLVHEGVTNPMHWCNYGSALLGVQRTEEAITALGKALQEARSPGNERKLTSLDMIRIYHTLGQAKMHAGDLDQAEQLMGQALKLNPGIMEVVFNLALIYHFQGRLEEAILFLQNTAGVRTHPQTSRLLEELLRERSKRSRADKSGR